MNEFVKEFADKIIINITTRSIFTKTHIERKVSTECVSVHAKSQLKCQFSAEVFNFKLKTKSLNKIGTRAVTTVNGLPRCRMWKERVFISIITLSIFSFLILNNNLIPTGSRQQWKVGLRILKSY